MSQVDVDDGKQNEEMMPVNVLIYAVDDDGRRKHWFLLIIKFGGILGICHRFENDLQSKSIVHLSNQIDNSLQLTDFVSTQPFSIFNPSENNLSS